MSWTGGWETGPSPARRSHQDPARSPYQLVGEDRVLREPRVKIDPPEPETAVLACRCGRVLDLDDMVSAPPVRPEPETTSGEAFLIPRIVCSDCAAAVRDVTEEDET